MKKIYTTLVILLFAGFMANATHPFKNVDGTDGSAEKPYHIETAEQLAAISPGYLDKHFIQVANITFLAADFQSGGTYYDGGKLWNPIGGNRDNNLTTNNFTGSYDGQNHKITNLKIARGSEANIGLFGHVGLSGSGSTIIKNVVLESVDVVGGRGTGALVGRVTGNQNTHIENCHVDLGTVKGDGATGGLVGSHNSYQENAGAAERFRPVIFKCSANVDVSLRSAESPGKDKFGGLVGCSQKGLISNSYSHGSVEVDGGTRVGGFVGCILNRGILIDSYSIGTVTGSGTEYGGFVGNTGADNIRGTVTRSFWKKDAYGSSAGGTSKTDSELKLEVTFIGWDFQNVWKMSTYPTFISEELTVDEWIWTGSVSQAWDDGRNWGKDQEVYPLECATVKIPQTPTGDRFPVLNLNTSVGNLELGVDAKLTINEGHTFTVQGSITADQTQLPEIDGGGTLILAGCFHQELPGMTIANGTTLLINNYNNVSLTGDLFVNGNLEMGNGFLDIKKFNIDLGITGKIEENESTNSSSRIHGSPGVIKTVRPIGENEGHIAGLGLELTGSDLGTTTIKRGHSELSGAGSSKSILRWFDISLDPDFEEDINVTMVFHYSFSDLNFDAANGFSLFKNAEYGNAESPWQFVHSTVNASARTLTATGITSFSRWTASDGSVPMPIVLLHFEGRLLQDDLVELSWVTGAEINNDFFTIERSTDGSRYTPIAHVDGAGNTSRSRYYTTYDKDPLPGITYYRLKQTDFNGEYVYYRPVTVYRKPVVYREMQVYPNPSNGKFQIFTASDTAVKYQISDLTGRVIFSGEAQPHVANQVDVSAFTPGIYMVTFLAEGISARKIQVF